MMETTVGSITLPTPLLLASGYITETTQFFLRSQPLGCAGMVTRSLKKAVPEERKRIPAPRYAVIGDSMLNCEWGNELPWTTWKEHGVAEVKQAGGVMILSLSGRDIQSCCELIEEFDATEVDAFEINISCSHSGALHGNLNTDGAHTQNLLRAIRPLTTKPIWVKLSYSTMLIAMARAAQDLGADAIVCTNSVGPGMLIDIDTARPKLGIQGGGGGLTGRAIFPIALWCVSSLAQALRIPVVGCGGVSNADQAVQMLMAGASAIQLYTAPALKGPRVFKNIIFGLNRFFAKHPEYSSISDLVGKATGGFREHHFVAAMPNIIDEKCTGCGVCVPSCSFGALEMITRPGRAELAVIDNAKCISCNACVGVCPPKFGAIIASY